MVGDIKDSVTLSLNKEKLEKTSASLKEKLTELKTELIHQIDSLDLDWIDIYKYIHPSYHPVLMLKDGQRLMPLSKWPIIVFLLSAVFCLLCSATYHLFWCLEEKISQVFRRLDYAGISILITGSCFPPFVYGFYCQPFYANLYLSIIGFTSIVVFFVSLGDKIHEDKNKKIKSFMYGGLGVFAGFPLIHIGYLTLTISETNDNLDFSTSIPYYLSMGVCYLGGLSIYASKCPERFMPGKVDIWGHSHQIWHICVLLGIVLTYIGAFDNYYTRMQIPCIGCGL
jgi:adiponectin receptor